MSDAEEQSLATPRPWACACGERAALERALNTGESPLLICDYDGTLAPFHHDKMQAVPYPGVGERLAAIGEGPTRLAFVSGRPVRELITLLPLAGELELWGMHGREHRALDGRITLFQPTGPQREALDDAEHNLVEAGFGDVTERKIASVALHWRAFANNPGRLTDVQQLGQETFAHYTGNHSLALLAFDGGLELRANDHNKGHAITALLATGSDPAASAFLGDDTTDEDGFRAIRAQGGVALLVRELPRPSHASFFLRPPDELMAFFDFWQQAVSAPDPGNHTHPHTRKAER